MASRRPHRSDVFQKNASLPDAAGRQEALDSLVFLHDAGAASDFPTLATPLGPMTAADDVLLRLAALARGNGRAAFKDFGALLPAGDAGGNGVQAVRMLLHAGLLHPEQSESSKAAPASIASIERLLADRQAALRLDRDGASARILGARP